MGAYKHMKKVWENPEKHLGDTYRERLEEWRREPAIVRIEKPTRIPKARQLGYKAKPGFIVVRARIRGGGRKRPKPSGGRKPSKSGRNRYSPKKSKQVIAEERVQRKYPNLEVLNSYKLTDDTNFHWFEIIMVDPNHDAIQSDDDINWVTDNSQTNRVHRGKTGAGKKSRGLQNKGKGAEKTRPSQGANNDRGK